MRKAEINPRFLLVTATLITLLFVVLTSSRYTGPLLSVIAFPFYLSYSASSYGSALGIGIFLSLFGPAAIFIAWLIVVYILQSLYSLLARKQNAPTFGIQRPKEDHQTALTFIVCMFAMIALDIFFALSQ